jgi:phosphopantetheinyl transferase
MRRFNPDSSWQNFRLKTMARWLRSERALVIFVETNRYEKYIGSLIALLSRHERDLVQRFFFKEGRIKYIIHRGLLRVFLSHITGKSPNSISFDVAKEGKLFLTKANNKLDLRFNLSHSKRYALYAFTLGAEIGVDIEEDHERLSILDVANIVLAKPELDDLNSLSAPEQRRAFFKLWTKKEALSKALGIGLGMNFKEVVVGIEKTSSEKEPINCRNMHLFDLSRPGFFASLAVENRYPKHLNIKHLHHL